MTRRRGLSLRARLVSAAALIASLAVLGALLSIYSASEMNRRINTAVMAQQRMELFSLLSARVNDYGMVAAEATRIGTRTDEQRRSLLQSRQDIVAAAFDRLEDAIKASVDAAGGAGNNEQSRLATQGLTLARMKAQYALLARTLSQHDGIDPSRLRVALDGFATQFSPLLDQAIAQERRDRDAAFRSADSFRSKMFWASGAVAALALLSLAIFQLGLVRPLIRRIGKITRTAQKIGGGARNHRIEIEQRDELGLLFANVNRLAARLDRQRAAVDSDRSELNAIIAQRTDALKTANLELEAADTQRRRFFADVSHELRTPLTVILGEADIAMRSKDLNVDQARESMSLIGTRARRLNRRIDDLLRIARSESGEIELESAVFDVNAAAQDAVNDLSALAKRRNVSLITNSTSDAFVIGDQDWVRQVISGLIDNALRYAPAKSEIITSVACDASFVSVSILDDGPGIPEAEQKAVFERFQRGRDASESTGFGVGLALASWIIERQAGTVILRSPTPKATDSETPPRGTEITIRLPRAMEDTDDAHARPDR